MTVGTALRMRAFGRPAGLLGRLGGLIMARGNRGIARRAIGLLDVQPGHAVLEVGFGPGVGVELLLEAAAKGRVAGVDPSNEMLEQARARNAKAVAAGRADLRLGVAEALPFGDADFDRAMAINSMQIWSDRAAGLRELRRVLKPGGRIVLGFTRHSGQRREGLAGGLAAAGFADVRVVDAGDGRDFCAIATRP